MPEAYTPPVEAIDTSSWQLLAYSVEHKQNLLSYARQCGVPVASGLWGHDTDSDLYLSFLSDRVGIISLPKRHTNRITTLLTGPDFFALCADYGRQHGYPSQPAAELSEAECTPPLTPPPYSQHHA